jgi:exopolyphosphatase/guanosine-5'-triphosphate,3'-diphosphate pyrophosphatase
LRTARQHCPLPLDADTTLRRLGDARLKIYLVRQAPSVERGEWLGDDDELRPLSEVGRQDAVLLAEQLADDPPTRIVTAPPLRCQQTVQPLAARLGLDLEVDERLARGEDVSRQLELFPTYDEGPLMLCTHADVIASILRLLELVDADRPECRKGSVWVLEGQGYTPSQATYLEPVGSRRRRRRRAAPAPQPEEEDVVRAAVLDLGSTSFNLLIADVSGDGMIRPVVREKVMLRLGAAIGDENHIPHEVCERACAVALELSEIARREKVERFFPVATAALRSAENGRSAARAIGVALGHPIRILSGKQEARIIFRAFQQRLELGNEPVLGLDLGGGSLEVALGSRDEILAEATTKLGVVRLHRELVTDDPMRKADVRAIRERVESGLAKHRKRFRPGSGRAAIAAGGTMRALLRLHEEREVRRGPRVALPTVSREELAELRRTLVRSTPEERARMRGVRRERADLLPVGAVVLETVARVLDVPGYRICDWGLREGILLDAMVAD